MRKTTRATGMTRRALHGDANTDQFRAATSHASPFRSRLLGALAIGVTLAIGGLASAQDVFVDQSVLDSLGADPAVPGATIPPGDYPVIDIYGYQYGQPANVYVYGYGNAPYAQPGVSYGQVYNPYGNQPPRLLRYPPSSYPVSTLLYQLGTIPAAPAVIEVAEDMVMPSTTTSTMAPSSTIPAPTIVAIPGPPPELTLPEIPPPLPTSPTSNMTATGTVTPARASAQTDAMAAAEQAAAEQAAIDQAAAALAAAQQAEAEQAAEEQAAAEMAAQEQAAFEQAAAEQAAAEMAMQEQAAAEQAAREQAAAEQAAAEQAAAELAMQEQAAAEQAAREQAAAEQAAAEQAAAEQAAAEQAAAEQAAAELAAAEQAAAEQAAAEQAAAELAAEQAAAEQAAAEQAAIDEAATMAATEAAAEAEAAAAAAVAAEDESAAMTVADEAATAEDSFQAETGSEFVFAEEENASTMAEAEIEEGVAAEEADEAMAAENAEIDAVAASSAEDAEVAAIEVEAEDAAAADAEAALLAALPAEDLPEGQVRIVFSPDSAIVPAGAEQPLRDLAAAMAADESLRLELLAYASGDEDSASRARRMSLSRALAVRAFLINEGVRSTRMDVRALGNNVEGEPADRVDILPRL